jgi:hypothetical protein
LTAGFNRARYDADQNVAAFTARLKDAMDRDSVQGDLAAVVHRTLEPVHVSVWLTSRDWGLGCLHRVHLPPDCGG